MSQVSLRPTPRFTLLAAAAVLPAVAALVAVARPAPTHPVPPAIADGTAMLGRLPVAFVPNLGQWEHPARFVARIGPMTMFLEEKGWTFTLVERAAEQAAASKSESAPARGVAVRMTFVAASAPTLIAEDARTGRHHYFLGNDPSKWRTEVPLYTSVRYRDVQPGVDVRAREHDGHFEYDLLLQPDAELEPVEITVEGIERMQVDEQGALVMETRLGPVRMPAPLSWEEEPSGEKCVVSCRYVLRGENRFGFEVAGRRQGWALVVDPGLVWSTFLGGGVSEESVRGVALDAQGAATVVGYTGSASFPTTPGAFDTSHNGGPDAGRDAFVTRVSTSGTSLVYSTFLGGTHEDGADAVAVDAQGAATVLGATSSADFPTTSGAFDTSHNGVIDAFVARLSPTGATLVYSTFLGGTASDWSSAVAIDAQGAATVVGRTYSADLPTTAGAFDTTFDGPTEAYVSRISAAGSSLVYSTFLGGTGHEHALALALDAQGAATVAGLTASTDFPSTPGAFDTSFNGGQDAFVTRLSPTGSSLVYSTFLGGPGLEYALALALGADGAATVAGRTDLASFPVTPGAFDTSYNGGNDAFVARLSPTGSTLVYSTFLGGAGQDYVSALVLDAQGAAIVVGPTESINFPTTLGAFDTSFNGAADAFVTRLSPTGSSLLYSTFLGGSNHDQGQAVAVDAHGAATVAGAASSIDFPTTPGAFDTTHHGGYDGFITRLDLLPTGVAAFGRSSAGCTGALAISVTSMPRVGNGNFALTCGNAPPTTSGLLALAGNRFVSPVVVLGAEIWVDPTLVFIQLPANSNIVGASEVPLPIPNGAWLRGTRLFAQFFWAGPSSPPPCPPQGLSASNALEFTVQP